MTCNLNVASRLFVTDTLRAPEKDEKPALLQIAKNDLQLKRTAQHTNNVSVTKSREASAICMLCGTFKLQVIFR